MDTPMISHMIETALNKIRSVADSNTVIGEPIRLNEQVVVLPFSKVSVGYAAGGGDYSGKKPETANKQHFAGGNGAGISVTPLGFIIVNGTEVQVVDLKAPVAAASQAGDNPISKAVEGVNTLIDKLPEIFAKLKGLKNKDKAEEETPEEEAEA